jgi:hypothetical protein
MMPKTCTISSAIALSTVHNWLNQTATFRGIPPGEQEIGNDPPLPGIAICNLNQAVHGTLLSIRYHLDLLLPDRRYLIAF